MNQNEALEKAAIEAEKRKREKKHKSRYEGNLYERYEYFHEYDPLDKNHDFRINDADYDKYDPQDINHDGNVDSRDVKKPKIHCHDEMER